MSHTDIPITINDQINSMKKYIVFRKREKVKRIIEYAGYFRVSRYGKYLLSFSGIIREKPKHTLLFDVYDLDIELRKLFFTYSKKAEVYFKTTLSNSISIKLNDATFYLKDTSYTASKSEKDRIKKNKNVQFYPIFKKNITNSEKKIRQQAHKYPELNEYRRSGNRSIKKIPSWALFSYIELGSISIMYSYLRGDLKKEVLIYGYSKMRYGKNDTENIYTWLEAIRNLRNICAHHNKLVGKTSSVINYEDDLINYSLSNTDLFSRIYALRKVLNKSDGLKLKKGLKILIKKSKFDVYKFRILPSNWETLFDEIDIL